MSDANDTIEFTTQKLQVDVSLITQKKINNNNQTFMCPINRKVLISLSWKNEHFFFIKAFLK